MLWKKYIVNKIMYILCPHQKRIFMFDTISWFLQYFKSLPKFSSKLYYIHVFSAQFDHELLLTSI